MRKFEHIRATACARWLSSSAIVVLGLCGRASAQEGGGGGGGEGSPPGGLLGGPLFMMVILLGVMWLFLFMPQQRREKERKAMLGALGKGDRVVTQGGIMGTIVGLNEKSVVLKVSDDPVTKMEFLRGAVSQVSSKSGEKETEENE